MIGPLITAASSVITMAEINPLVKILLGKLVNTDYMQHKMSISLLQKSGSQVAERSFIIGTLAEVGMI